MMHNMGFMEFDLPVELDSMKISHYISDYPIGDARTIVFFNKTSCKLFPDTTKEFQILHDSLLVPFISFTFSQKIEESANLSKFEPGTEYLDMIEAKLKQDNTKMKTLKKEMINDFAVLATDECVSDHTLIHLMAFTTLNRMSIDLNYTQYDYKDPKMLDKIIKTIESVTFSK